MLLLGGEEGEKEERREKGKEGKKKEGKEGGRRNTRRPLWNIKNIMNLITLMVLVVKNPPANAGNAGFMGSIPGSGRSPGEGHGNPLQYSCLKNPMDRGDWWSRVHRITKNPTQRNNLVHTWQKETELEPTDGAQGPTFSKKGAKDECFSKATRSGS